MTDACSRMKTCIVWRSQTGAPEKHHERHEHIPHGRALRPRGERVLMCVEHVTPSHDASSSHCPCYRRKRRDGVTACVTAQTCRPCSRTHSFARQSRDRSSRALQHPGPMRAVSSRTHALCKVSGGPCAARRQVPSKSQRSVVCVVRRSLSARHARAER